MVEPEDDLYLSWGGQVTGPFSLDQIRSQLRQRRISSLYKVQVDGDWRLLRDVLKELKPERPSASRPEEANAPGLSSPTESHDIHASSPVGAIPLDNFAAEEFENQEVHLNDDQPDDEASGGAWDAFKLLAVNPVAGMPTAFERVGVSRALGVGIVFGVVSAVLISFAASSGFEGVFFEKTTAKIFFNLFVISIVPFVSLTAATMITRVVCKGEGSLGHACFVVGASLLPLSIVLFLARFIGTGNLEVIVVLAFAAVCHTLLMLFIGLTRILKISERGASLALPVLLIVAAWVSKIVYTALFEYIVYELLTNWYIWGMPMQL